MHRVIQTQRILYLIHFYYLSIKNIKQTLLNEIHKN